MICLKTIFSVLWFLFVVSGVEVNSVIVSTTSGQVRGIVQKSRNGEDFYSFRGLRYAEPPIGRLRFQPPQELKPWSDIFDATKDGPMCFQNWPGDKSELSEDCLILNVYTKNLNESKPVILFIHGGSLIESSGHSEYVSGPQYFMDKDVVLVTINYRLGIFGFITTGGKEAPGNVGFKDQVMALRWVNRNINKFGGDPNRVTIVGQSAGGISVTLHMVSPMSKGLFHRVISMSGSMTTRIPALNKNQTKIIADSVGCSAGGLSPDLVDCLRKVPADNLIIASEKLNEFVNNPIRKWNFVVEDDFGQERFLEEDPNLLMLKGKFAKVPLMIGVTSTEFATFAHYVIVNKTSVKEFNAKFDEIAPICFLYERETERSHQISKILKKEYFDDEEISEENFDQLGQIFSDGILRSGLKRFVDRARRHTDVYLYTNSFVGRYGYLYYPEKQPYGMAHGDDLLYLFVTKQPAPMFNRNDPENFMVEKMTRFWSNFAETGIPTSPSDKVWTPTNSTFVNWYELSEEDSHRDFLDYLHIWDKLFPEIE